MNQLLVRTHQSQVIALWEDKPSQTEYDSICLELIGRLDPTEAE
jgi:hypothetical protein